MPDEEKPETSESGEVTVDAKIEERAEETEDTLSAIGNALLQRIDTIEHHLQQLEQRLAGHESAGHTIEQPREEEHQETPREEPAREVPPESGHVWSKRIFD